MLTKLVGTIAAAELLTEIAAQQMINDMLAAAAKNDAQPGCEEQPFCDRFR